MCANQPEAEYYEGWTDEELRTLDAVKSGDGVPWGEACLARLEAAGAKVRDAYVIVHGMDTEEVLDALSDEYVEQAKAIHPHLFVQFSRGRDGGLTRSAIAEVLGTAGENVEQPRKGKYSLDNMKAYLIHAKDADKHLYDPQEVVTLRGRDYMEVYRERKRAWERGRAVKSMQQAGSKEDLAVLYGQCVSGAITKQQILLDDGYYAVYSSAPNATRMLDNALRLAAERRAAQATVALEAGEFATTVLFVEGAAGIGKTRFLNALCDVMCGMYGWRKPEKLAASNALDEYDGSEIVFLDDVRAGAMSAEDVFDSLKRGHVSV